MAKLPHQFYNLNADPFRLCPDHHFSFFHRSYKTALAELKLGLVGEEGVIVVTGRPGTGKTMLVNESIARLDADKVAVATVVTTRYDLLSMIASSFGLDCDKNSKSTILSELEKFLQKRCSDGKRSLLVIDEAQGLREDALEELRVLATLQGNGKPLLHIILVGQEALGDIINLSGMEKLRELVISSSHLEPLTESETIEYITHRLNHAGWTGDPEITKGTGCLAYHYSCGIPRTINRIFNMLLIHGCINEKHELDAIEMKSVLERLSEEQLAVEKFIVPPDAEEKINLLEKEFLQPLNRASKTAIETPGTQDEDAVILLDEKRQDIIDVVSRIDNLLAGQDGDSGKNTSEPADYPGSSNSMESAVKTDESTGSLATENNYSGDILDGNDELQPLVEPAVFDSPAGQAPDAREKSRWPGYTWLAVSAAIAVVIGLIIYSGIPQEHTPVQPQAGFDSHPPVRLAQVPDEKQVDLVPANNDSIPGNKVTANVASREKSPDVPADDENIPGNTTDSEEKQLERLKIELAHVNEAIQVNRDMAVSQHRKPSADKPETEENKAGTMPVVKAVKLVEPKPVEPKPVEPKPVEPKLVESKPVEPKPVESKPVESKPVEPKPVVIQQIASDTPTSPTKITTASTSVSTGKSVPSGIEKPVKPAGEKLPDAESKVTTAPVSQPLTATTSPGSIATPAEKRTTKVQTLAKADPVIIKLERLPRPVNKKPPRARVTGNVTGTADSALLTMDGLLAAQWVTDTRQQAPHLPSFITNCSRTPGNAECWSREHSVETDGKSVRVKTKSYIKNFTDSGFTIRYRHMLTGGANDKRRWEDKTHQLDCKTIHRDEIKCTEGGGSSVVIFVRNTSKQLVNNFTHTLLTSAKWMGDNQPAIFLPSHITSCQLEDDRLSCWSNPRKQGSGSNTVTIKTKALIGQIIDGDFIVKYRNLIESEPDSSAWEKNTHEAKCSIQDSNNIVCKEDNDLLTYTKDVQEL